MVTCGHACFQFIQMLLLLLIPGEKREHFSKDRVGAVGKCFHRFLAQVAQFATASHMNLPGGSLLKAGKDEQEGGLADAIGTDETDLGIVGDGKGNSAEEVKIAEGDSQVFSGKNGHDFLFITDPILIDKKSSPGFWPRLVGENKKTAVWSSPRLVYYAYNLTVNRRTPRRMGLIRLSSR